MTLLSDEQIDELEQGFKDAFDKWLWSEERARNRQQWHS